MADPGAADVPTPDGGQGTVWYVYGVQRGDGGIPSTRGVAGHDVVGVDVGVVRALVSAVPTDEFGEDAIGRRAEDVMWVGTQARAHEDVLLEALRSGPVIPLRFGAVYRDRHGLESLLALHVDALTEELDRLGDHTEWGVKLLLDVDVWYDAAVEAGPTEEPDAKSEGHAFFARRRQEQARREAGERAASRAAAAVHERLGQLAAEAQTAPPQRPELSGYDGDMILNASYLLADSAVEAFLAAIEDLRSSYEGLGATLEVSGPWPPHAFVRLPPLAGPTVEPVIP